MKKSLGRFEAKVKIHRGGSVSGSGYGNPRNIKAKVDANTDSTIRVKRRGLKPKKTPYYQVYS